MLFQIVYQGKHPDFQMQNLQVLSNHLSKGNSTSVMNPENGEARLPS
jgi:hypothetical protein